MGQVSIQAAFDSPNTLASATSFLRECSEDFSAQAAMAVVPKHRIAYPQVCSSLQLLLSRTANCQKVNQAG